METDTMNHRRRNEARTIGEQAAEWLLVLEDGDAKTRDEFSRWALESPLHVEAFLRAATMDALLGRVDPERAISVERGAMSAEVVEIGSGAGAADEARPARARAQVLNRRHYWLAASVLMFVAVALVGLRLQAPRAGDWQHFKTGIGQQQKFILADGSVLHLNTGSNIDVRYDSTERHLRLLSGEAMFDVQRDTKRPFRVYSGKAVIQAIGTRFNVNRTSEGAVVSVVEGVVRVSRAKSLFETRAIPAVQLSAGEQVRAAGSGAIAAPVRTDISRVSAWQQRRLIFVNEPLSSIAAEFNRYNSRPKVRIVGAEVGARRYAAAFDADDPESLMTVLERDSGLRVERLKAELVVRPAY